jgi:hypothetical protein
MVLMDDNGREAIEVQGKDAAAKHWVFPPFYLSFDFRLPEIVF